MKECFVTLRPHVLNVFVSQNCQNISQIKTNAQTKATLYQCFSTPDRHHTDGMSQSDGRGDQGGKGGKIGTGGRDMDRRGSDGKLHIRANS